LGTLLLIFALATCSASNDASVAPAAATAESVTAASTTDDTTATTTTATDAAPVAATLAQLSAPHAVAAASDSNVGVVLTLNGDTIAVEGAGVSVEGSTATITAGGERTRCAACWRMGRLSSTARMKRR
jgi:glucose/arabinose dehydrogenase